MKAKSCASCAVKKKKGPKGFLDRECFRLEDDIRAGAEAICGEVTFRSKSHAANVFLRCGINEFLAARGKPLLPVNAFEQMVRTDPTAILRRFEASQAEKEGK